MYGERGSWRNIYYYIWKHIDKDNNISFKELYENPYTKLVLNKQLHLLGPDMVKKKFKDIFDEIKRNHCGIECEEDEEVIEQPLISKLRQQRRAERRFNSITEAIIRRIR